MNDSATAPTRETRLLCDAGADARRKFETLTRQWKAEKVFISAVPDMAMLSPYQQIIGMGERAIPLILKELEREPDHWFWALRAILGDIDPVPRDSKGKVKEMAEAWIFWGKKEGWI